MPALPEESEGPPDRSANHGTESGGLDDNDHERQEAMSRIETPNATDDEEPRPRPLGEREQDTGSDRASCREIITSRPIIGLGQARAAADHDDRYG